MGLDNYTKRRLEEVKEEKEEILKVPGMESMGKLDPDIEAQLKEKLREIEMEQIRLERQNKQESIESELNRDPKPSLDSMPFSFYSSNSANKNTATKEENTISFGHIYTEEEKKQIREEKERQEKRLEDILGWLKDSNDDTESLEEEQSMRHR